jgi:protein-disulfide isomerase/uncharacterized membrane protein
MDKPRKEAKQVNKDQIGQAALNSGEHRAAAPATAFSGWRIAFLVLCTMGALLGADLLRLHIHVHTDPNYHSFCALNERIDCETVAVSKFAVLGGLPVALWGVIAYLFMGGLSVWGIFLRQNPGSWPFGILFWLSAISFCVSIALFVISHFVIRSVCIICVATYLINMLLFAAAAAETRRLKSGAFTALRNDLKYLQLQPFSFAVYLLGFAILLSTAWAFTPPYWQVEISTGPAGLLVGTNEDGSHWIGARSPRLEIVEFSDYQCPHCNRGHMEVRSLVEALPDKVRLIHRHFPLRSHPHAFDYAKMAFCGGRQGRFWEANDYLFANGRRRDPVTTEELAAEIDIDAKKLAACVDSGESKQEILKDVADGRRFGIRGTPTFVIGNQNYAGGIPPSVINEALSAETGK